jgi:tRNA (guanosine-2'-O-)-methyltransferase
MTPERISRIEEVLCQRQGNLTIVLENVFDPHNLAAVMRTCDAVGIQEVYAISDCIPLKKKWGYKSSRSANKWVDLRQFSDRASCLHALRAKYDLLLGAFIGDGISSVFETDLTRNMALVFGNEKFGVSDAMRAHCDGFFMIPQMGMIHSLNISVACAVTLYEAMRQKILCGQYDLPGLSAFERNLIRQRWSGQTEY